MKAMIFLAEGFEEVEALTVVDYLRRASIEVDMVSIADKKVKGAHGIEVVSDLLIEDIMSLSSLDRYEIVILPGGMPGADHLKNSEDVISILRDFDDNEKWIGAICAAPIVLKKAGLIDGKTVTVYPGFEDVFLKSNVVDKGLVVDGNIITAKGPYYALDFSLEIIKSLLGNSKKLEIMEDILYRG